LIVSNELNGMQTTKVIKPKSLI